jgi:hypothetical protein
MRLGERGVEIESAVHWARGGTSVYFRDPDNNLLELATPKLTQTTSHKLRHVQIWTATTQARAPHFTI